VIDSVSKAEWPPEGGHSSEFAVPVGSTGLVE
jgi:hypothetical protein